MDKANKALMHLYEHAKIHPLYKVALQRGERVVIHRGLLKHPDYLFVGEAPGKVEARQGIPFVGPSGILLDKVIGHFKLYESCILNTVPLMPLTEDEKIRKPTEAEIDFFRQPVLELITAIDPRFIILLGKSATECMRMEWKPLSWKGNIGILYHPAYYLRGNRNIYRDMRELLEKKPIER